MYLRAGAESISSDILRWLGMTLFRERKDYPHAARYLGIIATFAEPEKTAADVWAARMAKSPEIRDFAGAVAALDNFLKFEQRRQQRCRAFLLRGRAELALGKLDAAGKSVDEGLNIERENLTAALSPTCWPGHRGGRQPGAGGGVQL